VSEFSARVLSWLAKVELELNWIRVSCVYACVTVGNKGRKKGNKLWIMRVGVGYQN
jgi:hypothetical protein